MKISLFVLAGMTRGSSAQWPLKSVHNDCSQFNGKQQVCTSQASCEWWNGWCDNKDSGATTTSSYVSLEASEGEDEGSVACSKFSDNKKECKKHHACEWIPNQYQNGYWCQNKRYANRATTATSYVSLEASEDNDDTSCLGYDCGNVYDLDNGFEKGSKSYLRAGQVKK